MLSLVNIGIELNNKQIFSGISLSLLSGAVYVLKGENGSGKTSLLKIIAGLYNNHEGEILWNNRPLNYEYHYKYLIGYAGHKNAITEELSVLENLKLWADLKGNKLLLDSAITYFQLNKYLHTKCKNLSAGWKKRIALARMIIGNSKIWLLDEPEANLDEQGVELLLKLLQVKVASGGIALIASHKLEHYKKIPIINISDFKYEQ